MAKQKTKRGQQRRGLSETDRRALELAGRAGRAGLVLARRGAGALYQRAMAYRAKRRRRAALDALGRGGLMLAPVERPKKPKKQRPYLSRYRGAGVLQAKPALIALRAKKNPAQVRRRNPTGRRIDLARDVAFTGASWYATRTATRMFAHRLPMPAQYQRIVFAGAMAVVSLHAARVVGAQYAGLVAVGASLNLFDAVIDAFAPTMATPAT